MGSEGDQAPPRRAKADSPPDYLGADEPFVATLRLATDPRPVLLANVIVDLNWKAAALATFAAVKPVLARSLDMELFAGLSVRVPRLAFAAKLSPLVVEGPAALRKGDPAYPRPLCPTRGV